MILNYHSVATADGSKNPHSAPKTNGNVPQKIFSSPLCFQNLVYGGD